MLDNFDPLAGTKLAEQLKKSHIGSYLIEISGGITKENIANYFSPCKIPF